MGNSRLLGLADGVVKQTLEVIFLKATGDSVTGSIARNNSFPCTQGSSAEACEEKCAMEGGNSCRSKHMVKDTSNSEK